MQPCMSPESWMCHVFLRLLSIFGVLELLLIQQQALFLELIVVFKTSAALRGENTYT